MKSGTSKCIEAYRGLVPHFPVVHSNEKVDPREDLYERQCCGWNVGLLADQFRSLRELMGVILILEKLHWQES